MRKLMKLIIVITVIVAMSPINNVIATDTRVIQNYSDVTDYISKFKSIDDYFFQYVFSDDEGEIQSTRVLLSDVKVALLSDLQYDADLIESIFYLYESGSEGEEVALNYLESLLYEAREVDKITSRMDELLSLEPSVRGIDELRELTGLMIDLKFIFVNRFSEDGLEKQTLYNRLNRDYNYK